MILHLLKLVWHRKRANALVMVEIFCSFLIVFAVVTLAVSLWSRWRAPLGFSWQDVWVLQVHSMPPSEHSDVNTTAPPPDDHSEARRRAAATDQLIREIRAFPQVEAVAADSMPPYANRTWQTVLNVNGRDITVDADEATDGFVRVMQMPVLEGRWFNADDEAGTVVPIVVDAVAARNLFGDAPAVGQKFSAEHFVWDKNSPQQFRVVGVIAPYRKDGELSDTDSNMVFMRASPMLGSDPDAETIVIRARPGTPASFEAELDRRLRLHATDGSYTIRKMEQMRRGALRLRAVPVTILAAIALFLISMVALGLTGVLWQTVTRRMREIGLRRALGASGSSVRWQVLGEVALVATLAVVLGLIIVLQLPLLGAFSIVKPAEFTTGLAAALAVIYGITLLCGAYPSWLASRIDPADALRYE